MGSLDLKANTREGLPSRSHECNLPARAVTRRRAFGSRIDHAGAAVNETRDGRQRTMGNRCREHRAPALPLANYRVWAGAPAGQFPGPAPNVEPVGEDLTGDPCRSACWPVFGPGLITTDGVSVTMSVGPRVVDDESAQIKDLRLLLGCTHSHHIKQRLESGIESANPA